MHRVRWRFFGLFSLQLTPMYKAARPCSIISLCLLAALAVRLCGQTEAGFTFTTIVGRNNIGAVDGVGTNARFAEPAGIAADEDGNLYVADLSARLVRKISPDGTVSTIAGMPGSLGSDDGFGSDARFYAPIDIAVSGEGVLYVLDSGNHRIRTISAEGFVETFAGGNSGAQDGYRTGAGFSRPESLALAADGTIYVADTGNHTIRKIAPDGMVTTFAGQAGVSGTADGTGADARFNSPAGIAVDAAGNVYVSDTENYVIRKITPAGEVSTLAGMSGLSGSSDGSGSAARFLQPRGLDVDSAGNIYVNDYRDEAIRKITPAGFVTTLTTGLSYGRGVTVDKKSGNIFATDTGHHLIKKITPAGSATVFAGADVSTKSLDGIGTDAQFNSPEGLVLASNGDIFVADKNGHVIRKVDPNLLVTTWAGSLVNYAYGAIDGLRSTAAFANPTGIAADASGNLYVADANATIRKIDPKGYVTTLAGAHQVTGNTDGPGATARFAYPTGIALAQDGTLYIADSFGDTIRKIDKAGVVTTPFGQPGISGSTDGTGTAARFTGPTGVAFDSAGNLYVADTINSVIRKITPDGVVSTLAGRIGRHATLDGKGADAGFNDPVGVAVDRSGIIYVTDAADHVVRKILPDGTVTTIGGLPGKEGTADGTGSSVRFSRPWGIALDRWGFLYVTDSNNNTIRKGLPAGAKSPSFTEQPASVVVGAGHDIELTATAAGVPAPIVYWMRQPAGEDGYEPLKESTIFKGVDTPTLSIAAATAEMNGDKYVCVAENGIGLAVVSKPAALTVVPSPVFVSAQEASFTVGTEGRFTVEATGATALKMTSGTLPNWASFDPETGVLAGTPTDLAGAPFVFEFEASNAAVLTTKQSFTLKLLAGPLITQDPISQTASTGATAVLFAEVAGVAPITFQWIKDGSPITESERISGATSAVLFIGEAELGDAGSYILEATGADGAVSSQAAVLTLATPPKITAQPQRQAVGEGEPAHFSVSATSSSPLSFQWMFNGQPIVGATASIYTVAAASSEWVGQYSVRVSDAATSIMSEPAVLSLQVMEKLTGDGDQVGDDIKHLNGNIYDQVLLTGDSLTARADAGQVLRISFVDLSDDIVQVEFSGAGSISLRLDNISGPAAPVNYNQAVDYVKGLASIIIADADETTNVSVFTVGRITAVNQALFRDDVAYDGVADIASITISSADGKFGGVFAGNAHCFDTRGLVGLWAPGVAFVGPVVLGNVRSAGDGRSVLVLGSAQEVRIAGGDLAQANHQPLSVDGIGILKFIDGSNSHGVLLPAQTNQARLERGGVDVTGELVVD